MQAYVMPVIDLRLPKFIHKWYPLESKKKESWVVFKLLLMTVLIDTE